MKNRYLDNEEERDIIYEFVKRSGLCKIINKFKEVRRGIKGDKWEKWVCIFWIKRVKMLFVWNNWGEIKIGRNWWKG